MPNYIRAKFEGGHYFFTAVTHRRRKLFVTELARHCLREAIQVTQAKRPYESIAFCLLPEHQIRDERDLQRPVDYVHYNPVKHGLVQRVEDWPWSTYHRYVEQAFYGKAAAFGAVAKIDMAGFGE